ncbi:MAG: hypothetical protein RL173_2943 [Fibrobacterota bacterium]|jgi:ABC-type uncharacterized transport system auxiliary subunit
MNMVRSAAAILTILVTMSGCFSRPPSDYHYYVLDYVPATSAARLAQGPWKRRILVRNFPMGEAYLRPELVYRTSTHEIQYHWRDRWAMRPEQVVSDMVRRHVSDARLFLSVQTQYEENNPDYELRGRVVALEEYMTEAARYAHLDLRMDFVRMSDGAVLWSQEFDLRRKLEGEGTVLVVRALSTLLEASVDRTLGAIDSVMRTETAAP